MSPRSDIHVRTRVPSPRREACTVAACLRLRRLLSASDVSPLRRLTDAPRERTTDRFGGIERAAAREDREPAEQPPLVVRQQVITPVNRMAHRLLPRGQVVCAVPSARQNGRRGGRAVPPVAARACRPPPVRARAAAHRAVGRSARSPPRLSDQSTKSRLIAVARCMKSSTTGDCVSLRHRRHRRGAGSARGRRWYSCSPRTCSAARLVTTTVRSRPTGDQQVRDIARRREEMLEVIEHEKSRLVERQRR